MTRNEFVLFVLKNAAASVPGGSDAFKSVEGLLHLDDNPDNNVDEIAGHIAALAVSVLKAYESVSGKDVVHDEVFAQLAENIKGSIKLAQGVLVKHPEVPPSA